MVKKNYLTTEKLFLTTILLTFFIIFITVALNRYWQYASWYYDFGIFYRAISAVAQGEKPIIDHFIFTDQNILGDHFHPLIFIASPFVALFKTGEVLLTIQTLFVTLSGVFIYLTSKTILKNKLESFAILVIYLSFIGLHNALITEFHAITLLPLPLSMFFYSMVKKHKLLYIVGFLMTLITKETTFVIPFWFGILIALKNKKEWRSIGILTSVTSLIYGISVIYFIIPAINGSSYHYLKETMQDAQTISLITPFKFQTIVKTLTSFGFLPLLAPETLVPVLINWWSRFSSSATTRYDLGMHYNTEIAPTLALATIYGWLRLKKILLKNINNIESKLKYFLVTLTIILIFFNIRVLSSPALLFTNQAFYSHTKNFKFLDTLIEHIPHNGVIMAQTNIASKIAYRKVYMLRNNYTDFNPDYIVVDIRSGQEPNNFLGIKNFHKLINDLSNDPNYTVYYNQGEQLIFAKIK